MHKINYLDQNNYLNISKMIVVGNRPTQDHFSKVSIYNFSGLKKYKKGYIEMTEKIYFQTFEKCPGSLFFPLLQLNHEYRCGV